MATVLEDMKFLSLCSTSYILHICYAVSLVRYQVKHSKRNFISLPPRHIICIIIIIAEKF